VADPRHKRETNARPKYPKTSKKKTPVGLLAAPVALTATLAAVSVGVLSATPETRASVASTNTSSAFGELVRETREDETVSRSSGRTRIDADELASLASFQREQLARQSAATSKAVRNASEKRWSTADLNIWSAADGGARNIGLLDEGEKVLVTGRTAYDRAEIVLDGTARWVTAEYLSDEKPEEGPVGLDGACTNGTSVASGVSPNVVKVHEAVCAAFPEITTYGTFRGDGEHAQGLAVDIMVSGSRGWEVAEFVRSHYGELGVSYLIYSQKIWSVERGGEGWRGMSDRGSTTANHYDHVHVTTY
jgi:uncharacterized protein YcbK (DUF882 family)